MNHFETILTSSRGFGKSWERDQWLKDQPLNSKIKMIYASTHYAAPAVTIKNGLDFLCEGTSEIPAKLLTLSERLEIIRTYLHLHSVKTRAIHGKLYVYDEHWDTVKQVHGGEWVNATAWTLQDARDFLEY